MTAYKFATEAVSQGHEIYRVFFYGDGVLNANSLSVVPQDETNLSEAWDEFLKNNALIMCQKPEMLKNIFEKLFRSKSKREIFENNARSLALSKKSILDDYISKIVQHIES